MALANRARNNMDQQRDLGSYEYNVRFQGYQHLAAENTMNGNPFVSLADDVKNGVMQPV